MSISGLGARSRCEPLYAAVGAAVVGAGHSPTPSPGHSQALACGDMSVVTGGGEAVGGSASVFFQIPCGGTGGSPGSSSSSGSSREDSVPVTMVATAGQVQQQQRHHQQGKVTVKYDHKELRKRLVLEEWIVEQLGQLYGCKEEEMPDVEIDIDDLLDANRKEERASKLQEALVVCYKPTEEFIRELLSRIRA
jgi:protein phosphatase 1 regulatory subunit 14C